MIMMPISKVLKSPKLLAVSLLLVANVAVSNAQDISAAPISADSVVLLLFLSIMIMVVFMAAILGDKIIKLSASKHLGEERSNSFGLFPSLTEIAPKSAHPVAGKAPVVGLTKGFDIKLIGRAEKEINEAFKPASFAVKPTDYNCLQPIPKMLVKEGDKVKAGDVIFHDRQIDNVFFTAPVSGEIAEIRRGDKRAITEVVILADKDQQFKEFAVKNTDSLSREEAIEQLIQSGAWTLLLERPFGVLANPEVKPKAIHISTFDSAPLAVDYNFVFDFVDAADFQAGLDVLNLLTDKVHLNLNAKKAPNALFTNAKGVQLNWFEGPHPAGNVGVQIHHIDPINKGETVWTVKPEDVVTIGKVFTKGIYEPVKYVAVAGSPLKSTFYVKTIAGANIEGLVKDNLNNDHVRYVSGDVLTGTRIESNGFLSAKHNLLTVLEEGDFHELFGWILPQYPRPSINPTIPWSLIPFAQFEANTNTHGEKRAFVVSGQYEEVLPMDVFPVHLIKSILYNDFDQMEGLGIYEVLEEDLALCEFVCTSKQPVQAILREGLNYVKSQN
jgi:Na+-transporting NADH:ubiquinone oxidoreductase subunit A